MPASQVQCNIQTMPHPRLFCACSATRGQRPRDEKTPRAPSSCSTRRPPCNEINQRYTTYESTRKKHKRKHGDGSVRPRVFLCGRLLVRATTVSSKQRNDDVSGASGSVKTKKPPFPLTVPKQKKVNKGKKERNFKRAEAPQVSAWFRKNSPLDSF